MHNSHQDDEDHSTGKREGPGCWIPLLCYGLCTGQWCIRFVKNMPDGSVTIVAEGSRDALETFIQMLRPHRNKTIRVDALEISSSDPTGEFSRFGILW
jgi:hydrogenase maturation factor HypF (carbamoyltransferase family)